MVGLRVGFHDLGGSVPLYGIRVDFYNQGGKIRKGSVIPDGLAIFRQVILAVPEGDLNGKPLLFLGL